MSGGLEVSLSIFQKSLSPELMAHMQSPLVSVCKGY